MTKIRVKNYQSAKDVTLDISGLTVLKGCSNAGKSSVLKAIYSATHNRFRRGCVTWNEDSCVVLIQYTGEQNVLRVERSALGASPKVRLGNKKSGYLQFSKMNRDLPQEIQSYNNFGYVQLTPQEKLSLNFCTQFSPPLMVKFSNKRIVEILSYSKATQDAQKAKKWIDERASFLRGQFTALDSAFSSTKHELGELQKQLRAFKNSAKVKEIASSISSLEEKLEKLNALKSLLSLNKAIKKRGKLSMEIKKSLFRSKALSEKENKATFLYTLYNKNILINSQADKAKEIITCLSRVSDKQLNSLKLQQLLKSQVIIRKRGKVASTIVSAISELESLVTQHIGRYELKACIQQAESLEKSIRFTPLIVKKLESLISLNYKQSQLILLQKYKQSQLLIKKDLERSEHALSNAECPLCGTRIFS